MDSYVPSDGAGGPGAEALQNAERAMEEHEIGLVADLYARTVPMVPSGASREERLAALVETVLSDPDAQELVLRINAIGHFGGGRYLRRVSELDGENPESGQ